MLTGSAARGGSLLGFFDGALVGAFAPRAPCVGAGFEPGDGTGQPDGEDGEGKGRDQVDGDHDGGEGDYQRADEVERIDEVVGEGQTERAADAYGAGEEAQGGEGESRAERQGEENRAEDLDAAGLQFLAADPLPGEQEGEQREEKGGGAEHLEEEVGEIGARVTDEVERARGGGGIERRVLGVVRDQTQEHHQAQR